MKKKAFALAAASTLVFAVQAALAQDKPKPPPAWHQGKPPAMADSKLAPVPGKLTETPASEIPLHRLQLPKGFKAEIWASGLPGGRAMAFSDSQKKMWVGTRALGRVYEITDYDDRRNVRVLVDQLTQPAGVAFRKGSLYVFAINRVLRYDGIEKNPAAQPVDMTAAFKLPPEQHHNWKYVAFGPDGKLYVPFGAPCNVCEPSPIHYAHLRRYNPDGSGIEVIATGIRNTVGFDWHPKTKQLWFTDHGRDWMGDDTPDEELNIISRKGQFFGFPYCHANGVADPDIKRADPCKDVTLPIANLGPHTAVMGIHFYTGTMFPPEYQGVAFIARKGSWNRTKKSGYDVVTVKAGPDGKNAKITPFATGFMNPADDSFWGRPAYFAQMKDGSLLISDEQLGAIYRITYSVPKQ